MQYMIGSYTLGMLLMRMGLGPIQEKLGLRRAFWLMGGIGALGMILCGSAESYPMLIFSRMVHGAGMGALFILAVLVFPRFSSRKAIGYNLGFISFNVGLVIGPLIAAFLVTQLQMTWRELFYLSAAAQIAILPIFIKAPNEKTESPPSGSNSFLVVLSSPVIVLNMLWGTAATVQYLTYISQIPHAIEQTMGYSNHVLSLVLCLSSLSSIIFGLGWNLVLAKVNNKTTGRLAFALSCCLAIYSVYMLIAIPVLTFSSLLVFMLFQNMISALVLPFSLGQATAAMSDREGTIISLASVFRSLFTTLSTTACAIWISESSFSLHIIFIVTSIAVVLPGALLRIRSKSVTQPMEN